jgi:hypothetical protein
MVTIKTISSNWPNLKLPDGRKVDEISHAELAREIERLGLSSRAHALPKDELAAIYQAHIEAKVAEAREQIVRNLGAPQ